MSDYNPNIYWEVDGIRYPNKVDAMIASTRNQKSPIKYYCFDEQFKQIDWTIEPTETFEELAAIRAHQLRDNSKYIRLWYSGGADSHTVLRAFLDNNIHLDEIVVVRSSPIDDFETMANVESNLRAIPYLKSIQHIVPRTKMIIVDVTAAQYLDYYKTEWFAHTKEWDFCQDPAGILASREKIEKYSDLKIVPGGIELSGGDKPKIIRKDGVYYCPVVDNVPYAQWANNKEFFTTGDFPLLHSKQSHVWKHELERRFPGKADITHEIYNPQTIDPDLKKAWYYCCREIINYDVDLGKGWKLISPKSQLRYDEASAKNPDLVKYFEGSLLELQPKIKHYWAGFEEGVTGVMSDAYCLGPYPK